MHLSLLPTAQSVCLRFISYMPRQCVCFHKYTKFETFSKMATCCLVYFLSVYGPRPHFPISFVVGPAAYCLTEEFFFSFFLVCLFSVFYFMNFHFLENVCFIYIYNKIS